MTEQEIKEQVARFLFDEGDGWRYYDARGMRGGWDSMSPSTQQLFLDKADGLLALLKEQAGYVQLAEDQSLPLSGPYSLHEAEIVRQARNDMLAANFKKIRKEA